MLIDLDPTLIKPAKPETQSLDGTLPSLMRTLRQEAGMTQQAVADVLGVERTSVTMLERNGSNVNFQHVEKLAAYLGMDVVITFKAKATP